MVNMENPGVLTLVKNIVEKHGCKLVEVDLENYVINIDGPEDAQFKCALAIEEVLG
jgi:hypothetical protein